MVELLYRLKDPGVVVQESEEVAAEVGVVIVDHIVGHWVVTEGHLGDHLEGHQGDLQEDHHEDLQEGHQGDRLEFTEEVEVAVVLLLDVDLLDQEVKHLLLEIVQI